MKTKTRLHQPHKIRANKVLPVSESHSGTVLMLRPRSKPLLFKVLPLPHAQYLSISNSFLSHENTPRVSPPADTERAAPALRWLRTGAARPALPSRAEQGSARGHSVAQAAQWRHLLPDPTGTTTKPVSQSLRQTSPSQCYPAGRHMTSPSSCTGK